MWPFKKRTKAFPKPLESFFTGNHACPDCGSTDWSSREDGGHDVVFRCDQCGSQFGVQMPPFNLIERVGAIMPYKNKKEAV